MYIETDSIILKNICKVLLSGVHVESEYAESIYHVEKYVGLGGFGVAFAARAFGNGPLVCLKVVEDQSTWHQEAYFGSLLKDQSRVIQLIDQFPYRVQLGREAIAVFMLVFEYAEHGCLSSYLQERGAWTENRARREIIALLKVLSLLHAGGAMHRDLTPMNILVTAKGVLKLNDFGIARLALPGKSVPADTFNGGFVSQGKFGRGRRNWRMSDDVFQMGQLLAMLIKGDPTKPLHVSQVQALPCSADLKQIIRKSVGARKDRYESAYDMLLALEGHQVEKATVRTLRNKRVVFTGPLTIRRQDAVLMVQQAGGIVQDKVHMNTDVVVVGQRSQLYKHKLKGTKLRKTEAMKKKGARIRFINEPQFMRLVKM